MSIEATTLAEESHDLSDSPNLSLPPCVGDSEGESSSDPTTDVSSPEKELPSPVCLTLEDGPSGQEGIREGVGTAADSTTRVMGLLGMGHRLFVPRLLAVREGERFGTFLTHLETRESGTALLVTVQTKKLKTVTWNTVLYFLNFFHLEFILLLKT